MGIEDLGFFWGLFVGIIFTMIIHAIYSSGTDAFPKDIGIIVEEEDLQRIADLVEDGKVNHQGVLNLLNTIRYQREVIGGYRSIAAKKSDIDALEG